MDGRKKKRGKNIKYKRSWTFSNKENFDTWFLKFKLGKNWQQKSQKNEKKFIRYAHNNLRKDRINKTLTCEYSTAKNKFCEARMKVPIKTEGPYVIELNDDGYEHFFSEFVPEVCEAVVSKDDLTSDEMVYLDWFSSIPLPQSENEQDGLVDLGANNNADVAVVDSSSSSIEPEIVNEVDDWEQFANSFAEVVKISPEKSKTRSQLEPLPPSIINISANNDVIDWKLLGANKQLRMIFARCTSGATRDIQFIKNFSAMIALNLPQLGVSHFFLGGLNSPTPEEQFEVVKQVLEEAGFRKRKDLFAIVVQTEHNSDFSSLSYTAKLIKFIALIRKANIMRPIIGCNNNSWNTLIDHSNKDVEDRFSKLPLWISHYGDIDEPRYPETWNSRGIPWWMWNYTHSGSMSGIINTVYFNRRNESFSINDKYFHSNV